MESVTQFTDTKAQTTEEQVNLNITSAATMSLSLEEQVEPKSVMPGRWGADGKFPKKHPFRNI